MAHLDIFCRIIPVQSKKQQKKHTPAIKNLFFLVSESTYRHQANIDDEVVTMEILDTAGQVRETILEEFVVNTLELKCSQIPSGFLILEFFSVS